MTGSDDAFLTTIVRIVGMLPANPLFGSRLQPAFVEDVAQAIAPLTSGTVESRAPVFEFGGARIYTYRNLVRRKVCRRFGVRARLVSVRFQRGRHSPP
jgi:NADH dehydrogenase